ncbi:tripartite tricarboxylate transporter substrate binding protein [Asanoa iriomotensis]|uniref:C4-dicarboxylate ABC transporter substrate-binding protein n=2 Tax=Asanoa iriomotensis TaxID=234613 RepID=A0ABQ4CDL6_9ACTN|nr:C4-dicarboxylate ABC transporter substrate-binding protein [Asanoa iriomotensis]
MLLPAAGCGRDNPERLRLMVPNAPGSGYDVTARAVGTALDESGVARGVEIFHLPGAGGAVGLQRLVYERGNGTMLMLMGLGLVGAQHSVPRSATLADVTPVARLVEEPEAFVVTRDSPLRTMADLVAAWRAAPAALAVGGGSTTGGPDHLAPMLVAKAVGVPPPAVNYVRYDGGGTLLAAALAGRVAVAVSSLGEYTQQIISGRLRVLAVTGAARTPGVDAPTLREAGIDVAFLNWRGLVAPPGLSPADERRLLDIAERLRASPAWQDTVARNPWADAYLPGAEFGTFLREADTLRSRTLTALGLTEAVADR